MTKEEFYAQALLSVVSGLVATRNPQHSAEVLCEDADTLPQTEKDPQKRAASLGDPKSSHSYFEFVEDMRTPTKDCQV
jgi:hypothetical protein